jgi:hypothetical protein
MAKNYKENILKAGRAGLIKHIKKKLYLKPT